MNHPEPISVVLIALDEERRIAPVLTSVAWAEEILVVDGGSTDRTREVSRAAGARVVERPFRGFVDQKNFALDQASFDWVLALDADEEVTPELSLEIQSLRRSGFDAVGYRVPRVAFYLGRFIRSTDWYPDRPIRLFHRGHGRWRGMYVHESVHVDGAVRPLRGEIVHRPYDGIAHHLEKMNSYSSLAARQMHEQGRRRGLWSALIYPPLVFLRNVLIRRGFRDGAAGLTVSVLNAYYVFSKYIKLWELEHRSVAEAHPGGVRENPAAVRPFGPDRH